MFKKIYTSLILNSYRPFILSKLNLWNILNHRHTSIDIRNVTTIAGSVAGRSAYTFGTIGNMHKKLALTIWSITIGLYLAALLSYMVIMI